MKSFILVVAVAIAMASMSYLFANSDQPKETKPEPKSTPRVAPGDDKVQVWHDDQRHVTCWIYNEYYKGGISCIPDQNIRL